MSITRMHVGEKLSRVVIHNDIVYLCGQVAKDYEGDIAEQTRQTLARIDEHLAEAGTDKSKMLSATVYLRDIKQAGDMNAIWNEWMSSCEPPARTCVQAELAKPTILVEITVTATR